MAFVSVPPVCGAVGDVDSVQLNALGTEAKDADGNIFVYLKGVASTLANSWVSYDEVFVTTLLVANCQGRVAIASAAIDATTKWGWYCVSGKYAGKALAAFADNGKVYTTATAGSVDDADVATEVVIGAIGRSALDTPSLGLAYFELSRPIVMDLAID